MGHQIDETIARCRQGDRDAQQKLYEQFHRYVFRMAWRIAGREDAADITQQVFLKVYQSIEQFTGDSKFETWLYRVSVNECLQHLRRRKREPSYGLSVDTESQSHGHTVRTEAADLLDQALSRVEPDLRTIFLLREVDQLSYAELANVLQLSEGTVASRLNRARTQLQHQLVTLGWNP